MVGDGGGPAARAPVAARPGGADRRHRNPARVRVRTRRSPTAVRSTLYAWYALYVGRTAAPAGPPRRFAAPIPWPISRGVVTPVEPAGR